MQVNSDEFLSGVPLIASALDPRHKTLPFLSPAQRAQVTVKLHEMAKEVDAEKITASTAASSSGAEAAAADVRDEDDDDDGVSEGGDGPPPTDENANAMRVLLGHNYVTSSDSGPENEVESFIREAPADLSVNPLDWWKLNSVRYPRLATLARRYLCVPGTSVPSERIFSAANLTVNRLRTRLTPEHVDTLIFLNKNGHTPKPKPKVQDK